MSKRMEKLRIQLTMEQIKAAELLALNNYLPHGRNLPEEEKKEARANGQLRLTMEEIAEQVDITARQLYNWRNYNDAFINYTNELAILMFNSKLPDIMKKHLDMTLRGQGSMKGIELFYKFGGYLVDKSEVKTETINANDDKSLEERLAVLKKRAKDVNKGDVE